MGRFRTNSGMGAEGGEQSRVLKPPGAPQSAIMPDSAAQSLRGSNRAFSLGLLRFGSDPISSGWLDCSGYVKGGAICPEGAGWVGCVSYESGRQIEPRAAVNERIDERGWSIATWGKLKPMPAAVESTRRTFELEDFSSNLGKRKYCEAVASAIEYIRAGDIYQVNLAHRLSASFRGSARELAARLFELTDPKFGSYLEFDDASGMQRAIISLSPELFFKVDRATGEITTSPMKGTRAIEHAHELEGSRKDQAELAMIVDLMRNDLGRVCELGSVQVEQEREIEFHGTGGDGVAQTTATIRGKLRANVGVPEILNHLMPGGSITGTPKIRAMQIIEELEPSLRGPYCGTIGMIDSQGNAIFSIGIRTLCITGRGPAPGIFDAAVADYSAGAGIVADSVPEQEWRETLDKAWMLRKVSNIQDEL